MASFTRPSITLSPSGACWGGFGRPLVVILETEIWPVLYREAKRAGCSLMIVNGRISDRAFPRYRALALSFFETLLQRPDAILAQSEQDAARYISNWARRRMPCRCIGNLKYDAEPPRAEPPRMIAELIAKLHPSDDLDCRQHHARRGSPRCG